MTSAPAQYAAFAGVMLFIAVSPGPDMAVITGRALTGWAAGAAATLGVAAGMFLWVLAAVTGVSILLETSATAFRVVEISGAVYLIWLGVGSLRAARRTAVAPDIAASGPRAASRVGDIGRGFLSNILNPKAAVLFVALIPPFVPPGGARAADAIAFPAIAAAVVAAWYLALTSVVSALQRKFADGRVRGRIDVLVGIALIAVGAGVLAGAG
ncbi:LysE family translocator [Nocardia jinanensis]|uniref:Threonine transporter RhtB n=1 Tax=Nocardia jinanensis TaxID=382504 RepID=A0A917RSN5_9NOCA|nr:LysE family translocator [Nocardia jinanensis]GGL27607.1 threonine transporter RhtB [Nocardia jinanensis]